MMFCTIGDAIRGYDYVVRYNISQNDYAHPRQGIIDIYTDSHNAEVYNNTLYLTERALKGNQIFLFATAQSPGANATKFYNNIFYYDGAAPAAATQFGDGAIDWQSNIFYGFTNLPQNDNPSAPNLSVDPMLADPGKGGTGSWNNGVITKVDLSCYKLLDGSPAINAGMPIAMRVVHEDVFQIPLVVGEEVTLMKVSILRDGSHAGEITASMNTPQYGQLELFARVQDNQIEGYILTEEESGQKVLEKNELTIRASLAKVGMEMRDLRLDGTKPALYGTGQETSEIPTEKLYRVAKQLLTAIKLTNIVADN
jgi:hypothetical protein